MLIEKQSHEFDGLHEVLIERKLKCMCSIESFYYSAFERNKYFKTCKSGLIFFCGIELKFDSCDELVIF